MLVQTQVVGGRFILGDVPPSFGAIFSDPLVEDPLHRDSPQMRPSVRYGRLIKRSRVTGPKSGEGVVRNFVRKLASGGSAFGPWASPRFYTLHRAPIELPPGALNCA